jgi:hypothetical protein
MAFSGEKKKNMKEKSFPRHLILFIREDELPSVVASVHNCRKKI